MVWRSKCVWLAKVQTCTVDWPSIDTGQSIGPGASNLLSLVQKKYNFADLNNDQLHGAQNAAWVRSAHWRRISPCDSLKNQHQQGPDGPYLEVPSFEAQHPVLISSFKPGCRFDGESPIFFPNVMNQPPQHPRRKPCR